MPPQTASGGTSRERIMRGSPYCTRLSGITDSQSLPDMTSLVASRRLQNAIKRCTKSGAYNGCGWPKSQTIRHCLTQTQQMLHRHLYRPIYSHVRYDVTNYFRSPFIEVRKTADNAASDGFWSNFGGASFCLSHQLVGNLFRCNFRR